MQNSVVRNSLNLVNPQFKAAIENLAEGFIICSPVKQSGIVIDFIILYSNKAFSNLANMESDDIYGQRMSGIFPEFLESDFFPLCMKTINSNIPEAIPAAHFKRTDFPNKLEGYFDITITHCLNGIVITLHDVTENKISELKMVKTLEELERSNKELAQFAYVASHDLQEPLRMVSNFTNLLLTRYPANADDKSREYMNFIVEGAKRMSQIVSDLLTYSRVSTRGETFVLTDMNKAVEEALRNLQYAVMESHAVINYKDLPVIEADPIQMKQLFQNLLSNAIKFRSTENPVINIEAVRKDEQWIFSVKDNSIGIASEYFERIFVIFQRLHEREKYPGTGMGLSICKKIIERHGGRIWVESDIEKGSTFYFTIPIKKEQ
ncbi:MAG: ATP-binding protein [Clostridiales bacterium]